MTQLPKEIDWSFMLDKELIQVCFGMYQTQLRFDGDLCVSIEAGIVHSTAADVLGKSEGREQGITSLVALLGTSIKSVAVDGEDVLVLRFSNAHTVTVLRDDEPYEAYSISAPGKSAIVA